MKNIFSYISGAILTVAVALGVTACSPEKFDAPNQDGIPMASEFFKLFVFQRFCRCGADTCHCCVNKCDYKLECNRKRER